MSLLLKTTKETNTDKHEHANKQNLLMHFLAMVMSMVASSIQRVYDAPESNFCTSATQTFMCAYARAANMAFAMNIFATSLSLACVLIWYGAIFLKEISKSAKIAIRVLCILCVVFQSIALIITPLTWGYNFYFSNTSAEFFGFWVTTLISLILNATALCGYCCLRV